MKASLSSTRGVARLIGKVSMVVGTGLLAGSCASAGTIVFNDLNPILSFTDGTGGRASGSCFQGAGVNGPGSDAFCSLLLRPASGNATWNSSNILETLSNTISDTLLVDAQYSLPALTIQTISIVFTSGSNLTALSGAGFLREDGTVQTGSTINWSNGTTDIIQFQSADSTGTPEPGTWAMGITGLALFGLSRVRRVR